MTVDSLLEIANRLTGGWERKYEFVLERLRLEYFDLMKRQKL